MVAARAAVVASLRRRSGSRCVAALASNRQLTQKAAMPASSATPLPGLPRLTLILGGARSGKSRHAEALLAGAACEVVYIATAEAKDGEMAERIARHRQARDPAWTTVEAPLELAPALLAADGQGRALLVDCLTLWLTNLMVAERAVEDAAADLLATCERLTAPVVLVSNEVGQGIVPLGAMARAFVDHAGRLHQLLAAQADRVLLITAGLAQQLKP